MLARTAWMKFPHHTGLLITRLAYEGEHVSIIELTEAFFSQDLTKEQVQRILSVPIGEENHEYYRNNIY